MTLGENFHTLDLGQHPSPAEAQRPGADQIGLAHIAFQVGSYRALCEAYAHLVKSGIAILRATNHVNQRSFYFADPDGNTLEIYYEMPHALELSPTAAPTTTRRCRSAARTTHCRRGCSKTGPDRRSKRRSSASASGTRRRPPPDRLSFP